MKEFVFDREVYQALGIESIEYDFLIQAGIIKDIQRGEHILTVGQRCCHTFFIGQGLVRQYSLDDKGKEHILFFAREGAFLDNVEAVHFDRPSSYFVQALETSRIFLFDEEALSKLSERLPRFATLRTELLYQYILHQQRRITQLLSSSAEERYLSFVQDYPEMMLRVPQLMIASYLGVTPESLSRVRKALATKHSKK